MLGEVEETIYVVEDDEEDDEEVKVRRPAVRRSTLAPSLTVEQTISRKSPMLFVRGMDESSFPFWRC